MSSVILTGVSLCIGGFSFSKCGQHISKCRNVRKLPAGSKCPKCGWWLCAKSKSSGRQPKARAVVVKLRFQCHDQAAVLRVFLLFIYHEVVFRPPPASLVAMAVPHYPDAGHSDSSEDASDTIEMDDLEELAITPVHHTRRKNEEFEHHDEDSEDESGDEDDGDRALLAPRGMPSHGERDRYPVEDSSVWVQARRIVIEVLRTLSQKFTFSCSRPRNRLGRHSFLQPSASCSPESF